MLLFAPTCRLSSSSPHALPEFFALSHALPAAQCERSGQAPGDAGPLGHADLANDVAASRVTCPLARSVPQFDLTGCGARSLKLEKKQAEILEREVEELQSRHTYLSARFRVMTDLINAKKQQAQQFEHDIAIGERMTYVPTVSLSQSPTCVSLLHACTAPVFSGARAVITRTEHTLRPRGRLFLEMRSMVDGHEDENNFSEDIERREISTQRIMKSAQAQLEKLHTMQDESSRQALDVSLATESALSAYVKAAASLAQVVERVARYREHDTSQEVHASSLAKGLAEHFKSTGAHAPAECTCPR